MAYPDKTLWRDMHQKPADKLLTRNRNLLPLALVFIIFGSKCDGRIRHTFDAVIADGNPVCVFAKVPDDGRIARSAVIFLSVMLAITLRS